MISPASDPPPIPLLRVVHTKFGSAQRRSSSSPGLSTSNLSRGTSYTHDDETDTDDDPSSTGVGVCVGGGTGVGRDGGSDRIRLKRAGNAAESYSGVKSLSVPSRCPDADPPSSGLETIPSPLLDPFIPFAASVDTVAANISEGTVRKVEQKRDSDAERD